MTILRKNKIRYTRSEISKDLNKEASFYSTLALNARNSVNGYTNNLICEQSYKTTNPKHWKNRKIIKSMLEHHINL